MKNDCVVVWNEVTNEIVWFAADENDADNFIRKSSNPDILYKAKSEYPTFEKAISAFKHSQMLGLNRGIS